MSPVLWGLAVPVLVTVGLLILGLIGLALYAFFDALSEEADMLARVDRNDIDTWPTRLAHEVESDERGGSAT